VGRSPSVSGGNGHLEKRCTSFLCRSWEVCPPVEWNVVLCTCQENCQHFWRLYRQSFPAKLTAIRTNCLSLTASLIWGPTKMSVLILALVIWGISVVDNKKLRHPHVNCYHKVLRKSKFYVKTKQTFVPGRRAFHCATILSCNYQFTGWPTLSRITWLLDTAVPLTDETTTALYIAEWQSQ